MPHNLHYMANGDSFDTHERLARPLVIGSLLVFWFPIGLYLVWNHPTWSRTRKLVWTGCWATLLLLGYAAGSNKTEPSSSPQQESPTVETFVVTADFFPFKPGSQSVHLLDMTLTDGQTMRTRHIVSHKAGGDIEHVTVRIGRVVNGMTEWLKDVHQPKRFPDHYRLTNQFVEIGCNLGETKDIFWEPKLKLGAGPGDTWAWEPLPGSSKRYRVVEISGSVARIEEELVMDSNHTVTTITYRKGEGVVASEASTTLGHDDGRLHRSMSMTVDRKGAESERSSTDPSEWKNLKW